METQGLVIDSKDYGRVVVDIGGTVKTAGDAAKAHGAGMFIKWMPETKSFFLSSYNRPLNHKFKQGVKVRETMWIKPRTDEAPLSIKLEDVLNEVTDGKLNATGKLKEYITPASTLTTDARKPKLRRPDGAEVTAAPKPDDKKETSAEAELRQLATEAADKSLEAQMDMMGEKEEEKADRRNTAYYKRTRQELIDKLIKKLGGEV